MPPTTDESEPKSEQLKMNKWDGNAVKNALDDAVKKIIKDKHGWSESHRLADGRLVVSCIAVAFAIFALVWDYFHPFPQSRLVLLTCSITYFVLMGVLQVYIWYVEQNVFYQGVDEDVTKKQPTTYWKWSSILKKYDDKYTLEAEFQQGTKHGHATIAKSVANWINEDGEVVMDILKNDVQELYSTIVGNKKVN